jgi:threonine/homoserine/homoserine lactone efflux protein
MIFIELVVFLTPFLFTPGPSNLLFAANGGRFGLLKTLKSNFGYVSCHFIICSLVGLGVLNVLEANEEVFDLVKFLGILYVLWLSSKLIRADISPTEHSQQSMTFADGVFLALLNPKGYIAITVMFSQFIDPDTSDKTLNVLLMATISTVYNFLAFIVWSSMGRFLIFNLSPTGFSKYVNLFFGICLIIVAMWLFLK